MCNITVFLYFVICVARLKPKKYVKMNKNAYYFDKLFVLCYYEF